VLLAIAGILEVVWAYAMKQSHGFTRLGPSLVTLAGMGASFMLLALAMRSIPLGTAYPVWTGIGAVGTAIVGLACLGERASAPRALAVLLIVGGIALLLRERR
jgi:quaternary ammonium compound-resistance protein SugE